MTTVAIVGPGAIGGALAAWLDDAGHAVAVCVRTPFDRIEVEAPHARLTARPTILTNPDRGFPVDWALVTTKTYDTPGAAAWLPNLMAPSTRVAIIQNGVEHVERFSPFVAAERLLPVIIDLPVERAAPGRILQRRNGTMVVPQGEAGETFVQLFADTPLDASVTDDFRTAAWRKLCINSAGAASALVLRPAGVSHRPAMAELMRGLVAECVAVGRAEGAALDEDLPTKVVEGYQASPPDSLNSMHADRLAGRPMEIDARNGVIVRLGEKHGIPTPLNRLMVELLEAAQG